MTKHYKIPVLLVELEGDKAFALQVCSKGALCSPLGCVVLGCIVAHAEQVQARCPTSKVPAIVQPHHVSSTSCPVNTELCALHPPLTPHRPPARLGTTCSCTR